MANKNPNRILLHSKYFLVRSFMALGVLWTLTEILLKLGNRLIEPYLKDNNLWLLLGVVVVSVVYGLVRLIISNRRASFTIRNTNTKLHIRFADLFAQKGNIVIPVNSFFDHIIQSSAQEPAPVSENSVHGQLVKMVEAKVFRQKVDKSLSKVPKESAPLIVEDRSIEPKNKYPLGTVATLIQQDRAYYLVAVANNNPEDFSTVTTLPELMGALAAAWKTIQGRNDGQDLVLPLIGGGFANIGLDNEHLLNVIVASLAEHLGRERKLADNIYLVLHSSLQGKIRCYNVANEWS